MMKLYYAPEACSLASHIALLEVGAKFEAEAVDLRTKLTASGEDYHTINAKAYVPALLLDGCEILTENVALLDWMAEQYPKLRRDGVLSRNGNARDDHRELQSARIARKLRRRFARFTADRARGASGLSHVRRGAIG